MDRCSERDRLDFIAEQGATHKDWQQEGRSFPGIQATTATMQYYHTTALQLSMTHPKLARSMRELIVITSHCYVLTGKQCWHRALQRCS